MTQSQRPRTTSWAGLSPFESMERALGDWFGLGTNRASKSDGKVLSHTPAMDVCEDADAVAVSIELPGMRKDALDVTLEDGVLTVSGEKKIERDIEDKRFHAVERRTGSFRRTVRLPNDVDTDAASAVFEDGVLIVRVPKTEAAKPKRLDIA